MGVDMDLQKRPVQGGVFLSWTKVGLVVLAVVSLIMVTVLLVLYTSPLCACSVSDTVQHMDEDNLWQVCVNLSISKNQSFCIENIPQTSRVIKEYRLPEAIFPTHYNIEIKADIYRNDPEEFVEEGHVEMFLTSREKTDVISFHTRSLTTSGVNVTTADGQPITIEEMSRDDETEIVLLRLNRTLMETEDVMVSVDFTRKITNMSRGLYYGSYWNTESQSMEYMVATQLEPTYARQVFPCLDEPGFKATFNISLWRKEAYTALSNMPRYHTEERGDGWYLDHFSMTPVPMTTYLVCIVISKFEYITDVAEGGLTSKKIRYFANRDYIQRGHLEVAKTVGRRIFDWMEEQFDEPFIWPKTDMVAINNFTAGAMENWGLITYRLSRLLYDEDYMLTQSKLNLAATIGHELAHMWFGNVVTCSWWSDLWLQEGFASFYEMESVRQVMDEWGTGDGEISNAIYLAKQDDASGVSHPLYYPVAAPYEIDTVFSTVSYKKGACIVRMMRDILGQERFKKVIKVYIQRNKYGNVHHDDLLSLITQQLDADGVVLGVDFKEAMHTWIKQMGYPVINVRRINTNTSTNTVLELTQRMFLSNPNTTLREKYPSEFGYKWIIPFTYTTSLSPDWEQPHRIWLMDNKTTITLPWPLSHSDWLLGNVRMGGFYRVNYDDIGWDAIIRQLNTDHTVIDVFNRAHLLDDGFSLARSGMLSAVYSLRLTEYLTKEEAWAPIKMFQTHLYRLRRLMEDTLDFGQLRMYVRHLVEAQYLKLGWNDNEDDSLATRSVRTAILEWACSYGLEDCVRQAERLFDHWMKDADNPKIIRPDIRELVFCIGIQQAAEHKWNFVLERYLAEGDRLDRIQRMSLLGALGCTQKPWLISRYINIFMEPPETAPPNVGRDRTAALISLAYNPLARPVLITAMLTADWSGWIPAARLSIFMALSEYWSTNHHLQLVTDFYQMLNQTNWDGFQQQTRAIVESNIEWHRANYGHVVDWLKETNRQVPGTVSQKPGDISSL